MRVRIEGQTLRPSGGNGALGDIWVGLTEGGREGNRGEGGRGWQSCLPFLFFSLRKVHQPSLPWRNLVPYKDE